MELKRITAETFFNRAGFEERTGVSTVSDFIKNAGWWIIEKSPTPRTEADSSYDMARYEVYAQLNGRTFSMMIGKCRDIIVFGER